VRDERTKDLGWGGKFGVVLLNIHSRHSVPAPAKTLYAGRSLGDLQVRCVIRFDGQIDAERLSCAVCLTIEAEPLLGCRFVEKLWRPYWQSLDNLDSTTIFNAVTCKDAQAEIKAFLARPMDVCVGPQVQVTLFRSINDTLCVKINHMVLDGGGFKNYIGLLARTYRELKTNPEYKPETHTHSNRVFRQAFRQVGLPRVIGAAHHGSIPRSDWGSPASGQVVSDAVFEERHIEPERFAEVKAYCQRKQATMTDVLLAAFYQAMFTLVEPPVGANLPVMVTVDLRRYLPEYYSSAICDLASAYFVRLKQAKANTFEDTLTRVRRLSDHVRANQEWLDALNMELLFLPGFYFGKSILQSLMKWHDISNKILPIISNIGVIDPAIVDFGDTAVADVTLYGPTPRRPSYDISVSTFGNRMSLTASSANAAVAQSLGKFLDAVINVLLTEC
jgi:NRPS condensation-like uncharacterized protein